MPLFIKDLFNLSSEREYTEEGYLKVPARIARSGVYEYYAYEMGLIDREPDEIIKVYRPEEEVFNDESMKSFSNKPVTDNHPPELVNAENVKQYSVGLSGSEITKDSEFLKAPLLVMDQKTIKVVEKGKVELSNGYLADIEWTSGVAASGEKYDAIQRNIRGNHIAIVDQGRAGKQCRISDAKPFLTESKTVDKKEEISFMKITIDGIDYEVNDQAAQAIGKLQKRLRDAEQKMEENDEEMEKMEKEKEDKEKEMKKKEDELQAKVDAANSKVPDTKQLDEMVSDRIALIDKIRAVCPELKWEGKNTDTLIKEVVSLKCQNVQIDSVSSDYIKARFDILCDSIGVNTTGGDQNADSIDQALIQQLNNDSNSQTPELSESQKARQKMIDDSRNLWNGGAK